MREGIPQIRSLRRLEEALPEARHGALLIIGYGRRGMGDDEAGLLVARGLIEEGVAAEEFTGDGLALLERITGAEQVLVIDAVVSGAPPGTVSVWDTASCVPERARFPSAHGTGLGEALQIGRALGRLPDRLLVCGIEGRCFQAGSEPSEAVLDAVSVVRALLSGARG